MIFGEETWYKIYFPKTFIKFFFCLIKIMFTFLSNKIKFYILTYLWLADMGGVTVYFDYTNVLGYVII